MKHSELEFVLVQKVFLIENTYKNTTDQNSGLEETWIFSKVHLVEADLPLT